MPVRSRGCRTCVRRRVKCDGTRPICQRCQKANLDCDGPPEPLSPFRDETEAIRSKFAVRRQSSQSDSPGPASIRTNSPPKTNVKVHPSLFPPPIAIEVPYNRNDDAYAAFFMANFFNVGREYPELEIQKQWMMRCYQSQSELPISHLAIRCLFTSYYCRSNGNETQLATAAKTVYGQVLVQLREELAVPERARSFDTVSAVAILCLFEGMAFTSKDGWLQHILGMRALLEVLGPEYFQSSENRAVYTVSRGALLLASATIFRERCFLESEEWNLPEPQKDPVSQQIELLHRIATRLPGMMHDVQSIVREDDHSTAQHTQQVLRIYNAWIGVLAELRSWHNSWATSVPGLVPITSNLDEQTPFGSSLPFQQTTVYPDAIIADSFCLYHALTIEAHNWLQRLYTTHRSSTFRFTALAFDADLSRQTIREHALKICQAIPQILSYPGAHVAKFTSLYPLRMAYLSMPPTSPEATWMELILQCLADVGGIKMAEHMLSGSGPVNSTLDHEIRPRYTPVSWSRSGSEEI